MSVALSVDRSREDWIRVAGRRLVQGGVAAVAVEALARDLGVTKGSFYWHFRDRAALLAALIADWARRSTEPLLARLRDSSTGPKARLRHLAAIVAGEGRGALEPAIRGWAQHDSKIRAAVQRVDRMRLDYIAGEFRALGFDPPAAWTRARLFYLHLLGEHALALDEVPLDQRLAEAERVLELLIPS